MRKYNLKSATKSKLEPTDIDTDSTQMSDNEP